MDTDRYKLLFQEETRRITGRACQARLPVFVSRDG